MEVEGGREWDEGGREADMKQSWPVGCLTKVSSYRIDLFVISNATHATEGRRVGWRRIERKMKDKMDKDQKVSGGGGGKESEEEKEKDGTR